MRSPARGPRPHQRPARPGSPHAPAPYGEPTGCSPHQPPRGSFWAPSRSKSFLRSRPRLFRQGKHHAKTAALPWLARGLHGTPMVFNDPETDGQPESGPPLLRRKEGREQVALDLGIESDSLIDDLRHGDREASAPLRGALVPGPNGQLSPTRHRLDAVSYQVQEELADFSRIGEDLRELGIVHPLDVHAAVAQRSPLQEQKRGKN